MAYDWFCECNYLFNGAVDAVVVVVKPKPIPSPVVFACDPNADDVFKPNPLKVGAADFCVFVVAADKPPNVRPPVGALKTIE